ncbi:MAG: ThiF family adenylyltransferase [Planctomycetes bacterium]|nr:ThiF family adenylyltransferase [Planctomycetota bacterium]
MRFAPIGVEGQRRLRASRVLVVGCGALGGVLAGTLARAGVGQLRLVDRDFVELTNLQRQALFDEDDVAQALPKAEAAAAKLRRINSDITIEPIVADVTAENVAELFAGVDVVLDGTDNFDTRFLLNDAALRYQRPWVFGGCIGAEGQTMTILPGETTCLRCIVPEPPEPGTTATCDTAGIVAPIINVIASIQALEAIKLLTGQRDAVQRELLVVDLWTNRWRQMRIDRAATSPTCPACQGRYDWLDGTRGSQTVVLCGRNSVQVRGAAGARLDLDELAGRLQGLATVERNRFLLRARVDQYQLTIFPDGRAIITGTDDPVTARTLFARYVGV